MENRPLKTPSFKAFHYPVGGTLGTLSAPGQTGYCCFHSATFLCPSIALFSKRYVQAIEDNALDVSQII